MYKRQVYARLLNAPFDERLSLVSLILSGLNTRFTASRQADAVADACYAFLREAKQGFSTLPADIPDGELTPVSYTHLDVYKRQRLTRTPDQYTVAEILLLTEGSLAPVSCLVPGAPACERMLSLIHIFVGDENSLALNGIAQVLVCHNGVAAVHHAGVIAALVRCV